MTRTDRDQRIEELELTAVDLLKSAKTPTANVYDSSQRDDCSDELAPGDDLLDLPDGPGMVSH
ncbi:hypothetical protein [Paraburkholderia sp. HP33-1]|uniref:hypothetical protein n=1 Tax=Paraburkholderia sp. HP33-1 TaxID=2883243 RepID=UPI001F2EA870|nr:hypothetical protein [Paraburkholderia sp. HP33-1]